MREQFEVFRATTKQRIAEIVVQHIRALALYVPIRANPGRARRREWAFSTPPRLRACI
jgi:hypothetical protein